MAYEFVNLGERPGIHKKVNPFTGGEFSLGVLATGGALLRERAGLLSP
jgi:hypothetical protein